MKRIVAILAIAIFFLIIVGLILFKLLAPSQKDSTAYQPPADPFASVSPQVRTIYNDTPYRTVISCYQWYVTVFANLATASDVAKQPEASQCFTTNFITEWSALLQSGSDPVLQAQDYGTSWQSSITAQTIGQSIGTSDQEVTLGSGDDAHVLIVHTIQQQDYTWRIDSASKP